LTIDSTNSRLAGQPSLLLRSSGCLTMACVGDCFDLAAPSTYQEEGSSDSSSSSGITSLPSFTYSPLQPWQTRILCLHPRETLAGDEENNNQLRGDLLTANLHALDGVTVEGDSNIISYRALSYSWGRPELSDVLLCNGKARPISSSNAAALKALRHPTQPTYLWIDAICINQEDVQEKSQQVSEMLLIYKKAQSVTAWLGEADDENLLALACIRNVAVLSALLSDFHKSSHGASCFDQLRKMHKALLCFYEKPWLRRTWIRQEIFGARQLVMQCGMYQISWNEFIQGSKTLAIIRSHLPDQIAISYEAEASLARLLEEAQLNARIPLSGIKPPRTLTEVLLASQLFEVTDQRDTFYAILGMCNVATSSNTSDYQSERRRAVVLVDYSKPVVEVFNDASLCIIGRRGNPSFLMDMWHSYRRGPLHSQGLASWAVDWRSGVLEEADRAALKHHMRSYQASFETSPRVLHPNNYAEFLRRPRDLFEVRDVHLAQGWTPLWTAPMPETVQSYRVADVHDDWHWPELPQPERYVLSLKARVLNYVAHLTDLTCDMEDFVEQFNKSKHGEGTHPFELERAGLSIHARASVDQRGRLFRHLRWTTPYDPQRHSWRLAVLGVASDAQLSLVPSTAKKGDLIVAIAPGMLPMLIHATQGDGTAGGLFKLDDPYERLSHGAMPSGRYQPRIGLASRLVAWIIKLTMIRCMPVLLFLVIYFKTNSAEFLQSGALTLVLAAAQFVCSILLLMLPAIGSLYMCLGHKYFATMRFPYGTNIEGTPEFCLSLCCFVASMVITRGQLAVTLFWMAHTVCWFPELVWHFYRQTNDGIRRAVHRDKVASHLDNAAETIGRDYEFRGPIFVYQERNSQKYDESTVLESWTRWCGFLCVTMVNGFSKGQPHLSRSQLRKTYLEVFPNEMYDAGKVNESVWDRPIQEFWLR
jgi:hypothetical protein